MNNELEQKVDNTIEDLPEEVSDFMFGGQLDDVVSEISTLIEKPEEKLKIENDITFFLLGITSAQELNIHIDNLSITEEHRDKIKTIIQEKVANEIALIMEVHEEMDSPNLTTESVDSSNAPSPLQAMASIQERLTKPTTVAPITRDYSVTRAPETSTPKVDMAPRTPSMDMYREAPDK